MVAATNEYRTVESLMAHRRMNLDTLAQGAGVERRVIAAIANERFTPSPEQRRRVSEVLRFPGEQIVWGHRAIVDNEICPRL
ncbi:MAG TPA: hypothetical protein VGH32_01320 [Pirellulales bacterium]